MNDSEIARSIIAAVAQDGFRVVLDGNGLKLVGMLKVCDYAVPACIEFGDFGFCDPPRIFLTDVSMLPRKVLPHLDESGEFCAVDRRLFVFDRYRAAGQTRGLIRRATEVVERGLTKAAIEEIGAEFPQHWSNISVSMQGQFLGAAGVVSECGNVCVTAPAGKKGDRPGAWVVETRQRLSFAPDQGRPVRFGELLRWAKRWDPGLPRRIEAAFGNLSALDSTLVIAAPNGLIAVRLRLSSKGSKFQASLKRLPAWRKMLGSVAARDWPIDRFQVKRTDMEYILGMNGSGSPPLQARKIVLIGCGAIGGYLARMLAQNGAGLAGGALFLIDPDTLDRLNIRRHVLGRQQIGTAKADACKALIDADLDGLKVIARVAAIQDQQSILDNADLVIDATGEQGVSEMLNAWSLARKEDRRVTILHIAIEGQGDATQSFISSDPGYACYRCLQPDHQTPGRYTPLTGPINEPVLACGDLPVTRYGPAVPMAAAALACQHAIDWVEGHEKPLLRTLRFDRATTREIRPVNPVAKPQCPACGRA